MPTILAHCGKTLAERGQSGFKCPFSGFWFAFENLFFQRITLLDEIISLLTGVTLNLTV
jgi:hypothetical protein